MSCSEDKLEYNEFNNKIPKAVVEKLSNDVLQLDNLNEQNLVVSTFEPETQSALWQLKLDDFVLNNDLNYQQLVFINKLKESISVNNLKDIKSPRVRALAKSLAVEAKEYFGEDLGWYLINRFENPNQTLKKLENNNLSIDYKNGDEEISNLRACNCERGDCVRLAGVSIWGISWEYGTCEGKCYVERYFFGLWESDNTGRCSY